LVNHSLLNDLPEDVVTSMGEDKSVRMSPVFDPSDASEDDYTPSIPNRKNQRKDDSDLDAEEEMLEKAKKRKRNRKTPGRKPKGCGVEKVAVKFMREDNTDDMNNNGVLESDPMETTNLIGVGDDEPTSKDEEEIMIVNNIAKGDGDDDATSKDEEEKIMMNNNAKGVGDDVSSNDKEESKIVNIIPSNTTAKISNVKSVSKSLPITRAIPHQPRMLRPIRPKSEKKRLGRGGLFPRVPYSSAHAHSIGGERRPTAPTMTRPRLPPPPRRTVPGYPPVMSPQSALLCNPVPPSPSQTVLSKLSGLGVSIQRQSPPPPPSLHSDWNLPPGITITRSPRPRQGSTMTMSTLASALHMLGQREGQKMMVSYMLTEQQIRALRLLGVGEGVE